MVAENTATQELVHENAPDVSSGKYITDNEYIVLRNRYYDLFCNTVEDDKLPKWPINVKLNIVQLHDLNKHFSNMPFIKCISAFMKDARG